MEYQTSGVVKHFQAMGFHLSNMTLRGWEKQGFIKPTRESYVSKVYSDKDMNIITYLLLLRSMGCGPLTVKEYFANKVEVDREQLKKLGATLQSLGKAFNLKK